MRVIKMSIANDVSVLMLLFYRFVSQNQLIAIVWHETFILVSCNCLVSQFPSWGFSGSHVMCLLTSKFQCTITSPCKKKKRKEEKICQTAYTEKPDGVINS